jgi:hypothetical protein
MAWCSVKAQGQLCLYISFFFFFFFFFFLSFLGSTAQRRPWTPQNPAEFLGGFSTIFFFTGEGC